MIRFISQLKKEEMAGKTCLLRINLDIKDPSGDSLRIEASLPTIKFLLENGVKILILSHRGRPKISDQQQETRDKKTDFLLKPVIDILYSKLPQIYQGETSIDYLENLRFDPREQANDDSFARELAQKGDFFVNDDFAVSHRANASVVAITKYLPSYVGLRLEEEIRVLSRVMSSPQKPLVLIIGGAKIDDKISVIENFQDKADYILMGSAYTRIRNQELGIKGDEDKIIFPEDFIGEDDRKLDIGPKTIEKYSEIINQAKTVIWNGPMGLFENPKYLNGSEKIAQAIIQSGAFSVIGGGDTQQLLAQLVIENKFNFVSTGGGAMLEFLSGKKLPALEALTNNYQELT